MAIPNYEKCMLPLLNLVSDGREYHVREVVEVLETEFGLSDEEKTRLLPSGRITVIRSRVHWAKTYLAQAGLLTITRRGYFQITDRGKKVIAHKPALIDVKYLEKYSEFREFQQRKKEKTNTSTEILEEVTKTQTPDEAIEYVYQDLRSNLIHEIVDRLKTCSPDFFERLVIDVLLAMGYGGSRKDAGDNIGKSGDEGIDGIIKEDRLGLDIVYIQAKRWVNPVGRPEVHKFVGALHGQRARKGILITTSYFSKEAVDYVKNIDPKIVLIDGEHLAELMIDFDIGVSKVVSYDIKRIDSDYFSEE